MHNQSKKPQIAGFKSPSKINLVRSKSTDHLTSTHKSVGRKHTIQKPFANDSSGIKLSNLSKSKSTKSLKPKNKTSTKCMEAKSAKKIKPKPKKSTQSDCKTVKKIKNLVKANLNLSEESFNSQQSAKPQQALQYFFYHNTYIPIENSAQRRFVFKIKEIDQRNDATADTLYKKPYESCILPKDERLSLGIKQTEVKELGVGTQKMAIAQYGTNTTPRTGKQFSIQTQSAKFQEDIKKCFATTLNDLEFLFLPDQKNFQGFSKAQKLHYRQLFESIAKKIWKNGQALEELTDQKVHMLLYQRQCVQMGMIESFPDEGFPTHIFSVMSYLTNLFSFAQMNEKSEALEKIHSIYGFSYQERLSRLLKGFPTKKRSNAILSEDLFLMLEKELVIILIISVQGP